MSNKLAKIIALFLLAFVFIIAFLSIQEDSLTMDELAHLPAGYSYLSQMDMRINPEHPPLVKDFSAVPLLFLKDINFPYDAKSWANDINGQWEFGNTFLFKSNNPAEEMIILARIPMIIILIIVGYFIFRFTRELYANNAGVLALLMFSLSPTFLAHGRLVTTDVGAALGTIMATYYFLKFLKNPEIKTAIKAGIGLGIAELLKFSLILLLPFFAAITIAWIIIKSFDFKDNFPGIYQKPVLLKETVMNFLKLFLKYLAYGIFIGILAMTAIYVVYLFHVWNYPIEKQKSDTEFLLTSFSNKNLSNAVVFMSEIPALRPLGQYFLGLFMVFQRASGGNTGYFLGEISAAGWKTYFPFVYFAKETLSFHIISLIALIYAAYLGIKSFKTPIKYWIRKTAKWTEKYFAQLSALLFIIIYWTTSLTSNLNIGVRHLLPIFPFTIMLSAGLMTLFVKSHGFKNTKVFVLTFLIVFELFSVLKAFPSFLSYFNEAVGGPSQGYRYVVDSNLDWGQDLKRLRIWLDKNNIDKVYLDYFGGSDTYYYLGSKYFSWWGDRSYNDIQKGSYLAVSATLLQGGRGVPAKGFDQKTGYYNWLNVYDPEIVIGNSIFVYRIQ